MIGPGLSGIDAVLAQMIRTEDRIMPLHGPSAVAAQAIIELASAGQPAKARELFAKLILARPREPHRARGE